MMSPRCWAMAGAAPPPRRLVEDAAAPTREVLLVGGGHANVQVLLELARQLRPHERVAVTLVSDTRFAYYSGMVPGCVAGLYSQEETRMDLQALAEWCGARFVCAAVTAIDPDRRVVACTDEATPELRFDVACINVGSTVRGLATPGVAEHALCSRPISQLVPRLRAIEEALAAGTRGGALWRERRSLRVAVVGGGVAGVELALCVQARLREALHTADVSVDLVDERAELLAPMGPRVSAAAEALLRGAAPHSLLGRSGLSLKDGFIEVRGSTDTFGSVTVSEQAGVYAVREGPVMAANVLKLLRGVAPLVSYTPQQGFLSLMATGDGSALLAWKGWAVRGAWCWRLKDWIDRRFMRRFDTARLGPRPAQ